MAKFRLYVPVAIIPIVPHVLANIFPVTAGERIAIPMLMHFMVWIIRIWMRDLLWMWDLLWWRCWINLGGVVIDCARIVMRMGCQDWDGKGGGRDKKHPNEDGDSNPRARQCILANCNEVWRFHGEPPISSPIADRYSVLSENSLSGSHSAALRGGLSSPPP